MAAHAEQRYTIRETNYKKDVEKLKRTMLRAKMRANRKKKR